MPDKKDKVCIGHIAEIYLYEYYIAGDRPYELSTEDTYGEHTKKGYELMGEGNYVGALNEWLKALDDDPVSTEALLKIISCHKYLRNIEKEYEYTKKSYDFCCTRSELAAYYRNLGWYYLEIYKPDVSVACYQYSNLFEKSEQVESEIHFLETATKKTYKEADIDQLQKILAENDIPLKANSVTLALLYKAGIEAYETGMKEQSYECFRMVYDLTLDEEILEWMEKAKGESDISG
ncbi:MAG: hypothetical protein K6F93_00955 [Lachnospiraceae bacterium]|nr:hypothetical protein [Lachnospiraceae bacterium]